MDGSEARHDDKKVPSDDEKASRPGDDRKDAGDQGGDAPPKKMSPVRKFVLIVIGLIVLAAVIVGGTLYWLHARHFETTDDAFIDGHISLVSAQVPGRVVTLAIQDNQQVLKGAPLLQLDPADYQMRLNQAIAQQAQSQAQLAQAQAQIPLQQATIDQSAAQVRVNEANLMQAQQDYARYRNIDPKAITRQQLDNSSATTKAQQAQVDAARHAFAAAQAQLKARQADVVNAEAALKGADVAVDNAQLQLSYAQVVAPDSGRVTKRTVELGNYVTAGQVLLDIVPRGVWVTANFKETQLALMKVGQKVDLSVDAVPDHLFHGHVQSFQSGTGSVFSTLPAENATGNYVKVVQRLPVKIVIDDDDDSQLAPGMSVTPSVTVR